MGNRRAFTRRLAEEVHRAARYGQRFALVVLDIDGFKALNDCYGHFEGDMALEAIGDGAARHHAPLRQRLPPGRRRVRADPRERRRARGDRASSIASAPASPGSRPAPGHLLRASFGVALGDGTPDPETLLQAADAAMYEAKRAGVGVRFAAPAVG